MLGTDYILHRNGYATYFELLHIVFEIFRNMLEKR